MRSSGKKIIQWLFSAKGEINELAVHLITFNYLDSQDKSTSASTSQYYSPFSNVDQH